MAQDSDVDILGLMQEPKPDWQGRTRELCRPGYFRVGITVDEELLGHLTEAEQERLWWKLDLVTEMAQAMALGMLKGTIKYEHDQETIAEWVAHVVGEGADQMNYNALLLNAVRRAN